MTRLDYEVVNKSNPILSVKVTNLNTLTVGVGETALYVHRVGTIPETAYPLVSKKNNVFSFVLKDIGLSGRYIGRLVYNGVELGTVEFIFEATEVEVYSV